ncbi:ribosomal RNA small subunit methyltransferase G [Striga asiatica]|uniref:Ribosomal RNA small subunit methyltransferase G n=1 Tax=Striga asiatica TaxID=4170 RepID=A0A5A7QMH7_STRAF|nr:ribosomal RNA small subunit methyltransferase G [Striga asiatica]
MSTLNDVAESPHSPGTTTQLSGARSLSFPISFNPIALLSTSKSLYLNGELDNPVFAGRQVAEEQSIRCLSSTLNRFASWSGLKMNPLKSKAFASQRVTPLENSWLRQATPIGFTQNLGKYLGF